MIAYKGFDPDFKCLDFQFEVGKTYTQSGAIKACQNGFHACADPFAVWLYYPVVASDGRLTRYAKVEQSGATDIDGDKIASASITIKAELRLPEFVKRAVDAVIAAVKGKGDDPSGDYAQIGSSGDYAQIGSSGDYAQIGSSGDYAQIGSSGDSAQIGSSGYYAQIGSSGYSARIGSSGYSAQIGSSGYYAQIGSSGYYAQIGSSGDYARIGSSGDYAQIGSSGYSARIGSSGYSAQIGSSGDYAQIGSSGYSARIGSSGDSAQIVSEGARAVIAVAGRNTTVSGKAGAWISVASFDRNGDCDGFATGCIGQDGLKPDTPYRAQDRKFVEVTP
jgi:hypothetical protein